MTTMFSRVKEELASLLEVYAIETGMVQAVRTARSYDHDLSPYIILATSGYQQRPADMADEVYVVVATVAKFSGAVEEEAAEKALDDVQQVIIDLFGIDGTYQVHRGFWGAIDFYKRSARPFSPLGPGYRYAEQYLRFIV